MATKPPAPIRILKPGTFTDIHGTKVTFAQADLDQMIASYDAASDPAPIVVGHPTTDAPAFGWIGHLAMEDGHLVAHPSEIAPAFAEVVAGGHYRKVSPQIYPPASPANPKPGSWYLQHVGFLGASPPAIKGMGTVAFAEDAGATITIELKETEMSTANEQAPDAIAFAEQKAALDQRETELKEREEALAKRDRDDRHAANVAFAEGLIVEAKLAPAGKDRVVGLLGILDAVQPVAFGEGDGATMTPLAAFQSLLKDGAPVIALGEHGGAGKRAAEEETPEHMAQRAVAFAEEQAKAGKSVSVVEAMRHVRAHPDA